MGSTFNDWTNIVKDILQGSILDLLLFNKFIFVVFFFFFTAKYKLCYFSDGNRLYSFGINLFDIFTNLIQNA